MQKSFFNLKNCNLLNLSKKHFKTNQVHYYNGSRKIGNSGIRVTIFGGTASIATDLATKFLMTGTPVNSVIRQSMEAEASWGEIKLLEQSNPFRQGVNFRLGYDNVNFNTYNMKIYGEVGSRNFTYLPDYTNDAELENAIKDTDIIINCVGPSPVIRNMEDFEEANVVIPRKIAKLCAKLKNDPVKRLIHFSANGADPDSISKNLKTKWLGEQEVLNNFPEATIIRPTEIMSSKTKNNFIG